MVIAATTILIYHLINSKRTSERPCTVPRDNYVYKNGK